jgi:hypothetical protein
MTFLGKFVGILLEQGKQYLDTYVKHDTYNYPDIITYKFENAILKGNPLNLYVHNIAPTKGGARKPLDKCTVVELKAKAKAKNIKGYTTMSKADIIDVLKHKGKK